MNVTCFGGDFLRIAFLFFGSLLIFRFKERNLHVVLYFFAGIEKCVSSQKTGTTYHQQIIIPWTYSNLFLVLFTSFFFSPLFAHQSHYKYATTHKGKQRQKNIIVKINKIKKLNKKLKIKTLFVLIVNKKYFFFLFFL